MNGFFLFAWVCTSCLLVTTSMILAVKTHQEKTLEFPTYTILSIAAAIQTLFLLISRHTI